MAGLSLMLKKSHIASASIINLSLANTSKVLFLLFKKAHIILKYIFFMRLDTKFDDEHVLDSPPLHHN